MIGALLLSLAVIAPVGQRTPDFSGVWVEDESVRQTTVKADAGAKLMAAPQRPITVKQSTDALDIRHEPPMPGLNARRYVYNLAGKESVNHNGANTQTTRSRWEGGLLVTEGTSYSETTAGESLWKFRETRALDARGRMIVEMRMTDEAGQTTVTRRTFDRKK
jgi:hypothetical protein